MVGFRGVVEVEDVAGPSLVLRKAKASLPVPPVMVWLPELPIRTSLPPPPFSVSVPLVAMMTSSPAVPFSTVDDDALLIAVAVALLALVAMPSVLL